MEVIATGHPVDITSNGESLGGKIRS